MRHHGNIPCNRNTLRQNFRACSPEQEPAARHSERIDGTKQTNLPSNTLVAVDGVAKPQWSKPPPGTPCSRKVEEVCAGENVIGFCSWWLGCGTLNRFCLWVSGLAECIQNLLQSPQPRHRVQGLCKLKPKTLNFP